MERVKASRASVFPIVDENNCLAGVFSLSDIRHIVNEPSLGMLIVASDLGTTDVPTVTPESNLEVALRLFTQKNLDELPVVEPPMRDSALTRISTTVRRPKGTAGTMRVVGMLSRRDLITAYHRKLHALEMAELQENTGSHVFGEALEAKPEPAEPTVTVVEDPALDREKLPATADASQPGMELLTEPPDESELS
jgi:CBS domain-containing protein